MNTSSQNLVQPPADLAQIRLASIVESSDDAIIGKDLNGLITSWNHGAEKIFGYPASEILGTSILRLIPADRQEEEKQILLKIKQGESVSHFETLRLRQDGRLVAVSITASPIWDATGRLIGVSKIARDITDRNLVEAELREKAAILEAQLESSLDGILVVDEFGRKILQNQRMNVLMKIPREVADDSDDQQQINWVAGIVKNAAEFKAKVAYLTAHPMETSHDELELKDGTALDRYSAPVLGKDGKYFGRIWTFRDITRHKQ